ncbi:MAG: hypothetical protein EU539_04785 [Promethearchaeota archaeon]|nr:MAG: hypothetical protein EU539_04785 [Candidatus Lokiarchaeota archaeon]
MFRGCSLMDIKMSNKNAYKLEFLGFAIFIIFSGLAMIFYAGGTQMDPNAPGYSFWFNSLSDSGRSVAHNGKPNVISMILFSIAWIGFAITTIPFYLVFPRVFEENPREKKLAEKGGYLGIIGSIAHVGIAFTPVDIFFALHYLFVFIVYPAMVLAMIFYCNTIRQNEKFSKEYKYSFRFFTVLVIVSIILGLVVSLATGIRELLTIFQKIGRISFLLGFSILTIGAWKLE